PDPWGARTGWRLVGASARRLAFGDDGGEREVLVTYPRVPPATGAAAIACSFTVPADGADASPAAGTLLAPAGPDGNLAVEVDGLGLRGHAVFEGETLHLFTVARHLRLQYVYRLLHAGDAADEGGRLTAPMPGKVIALLVQPGERVRKGQPLLVMEAMKMEHTI